MARIAIGMDDELAVVLAAEHGDDLQRGATSWPEPQAKIVVNVIDHHGVPYRTLDVPARSTPCLGGRHQIRTEQSYYETVAAVRAR